MWKKLLPLLALLVLPARFAAAQDKAADLAIIVHPGCSLDNVSTADLAKIFKVEKTKTPEGGKFVVVVRDSGSPERNAALKAIYQMDDAACEKFYLQATFAGTIQAAPKQLTSGSAVRQFVASTPGGISYVRGSEADASVKVLKVDGKAPGDPGYPIKIP